MVLRFSQRFGMVPAGAGVTRLLMLLLMVAAAPSRARGSGCRVGAAARGAGADGREAEGCGTVALLLEHSFEIGEISVSSASHRCFGGEGRNHR